jgi:hypothetical protein
MFRMRSFARGNLALWVVVALLPLVASGLLLRVTPVRAQSSDLVITGVIDGPLSGGVPKAIELYALTNISDLSIYGLESANNGNPASGPEFTFPADTASAGEFLYVASESTGFTDFFDFAPDYTGGVASINGDDAIALYQNGTIVDVFGEIGVDGTGQPWEHLDGWAYRVDGTGPDGNTFGLSNWTFSGPNALDGETSNNTAATPFPIGTYSTGGGGDPVSPLLVINEIDYDQPGSDTAEFIELYNSGSVSANLDAYSIELINGNGNTLYDSVDLPNVELAAGDYFVICADSTTTPNCDLAVLSSIQNGAPDAAAVVLNGQIVDTISYEGEVPGYTEGSGAPADPATDFTGLSRFPDGTDTDDNNADFSPRCITPGEANTDATTNCPPPGGDVIGQCGDPATLISAIQGAGTASPLEGQTHTIEGIVVGDFQEGDNDDTPALPGYDSDLDGFYVQEENSDWDADPATSEGIFVYAPGAVNVNPGDIVRVTGEVTEFFDLTELTNVSAIESCGSASVPTPTDVTLPVTSLDEFERYEGMLVRFPQELVISEYFNFDRFGEIVLALPLDGLERPFQPTSYVEPGSTEYDVVADAIERSRITLDDARSSQNPDPARHPNGAEFTLDNRFRGGDTVTNAIGVLDYRFGKYRIQPTQDAGYTRENPRPAEPADVGGSLTVASFNVLNYFTTFGSRGADNQEEFERQRDKIIAALAAIDADIVGLIEIENNTAALQDLVSGLNNAVGAGTYDYIETGAIGTDAIKVAFIYKPGSVTPVGEAAVLDTPEFVSPNTSDPKNRPALAQTFAEDATGGVFTVVVNHFKSKGSSCGAGDDDPQQGNCNLTRTLAAQELVDWLATDPTGSNDPDVMIIGDLNAYDEEDPIDAIKAGGYVDLIELYEGEFAYSFVFDGQFGYLDYALVNQALLPQVTGTTEWHINADEPDILNYDTTFKQDAQDALYALNPYRSSDHDPVIVGLDLEASTGTVTIINETNPGAPWLNNFNFGGDLGNFSLDGSNDGSGNRITFDDAPVGEPLTVSVVGKPGNWDLTAITCTTDGATASVDLSTASAEFTLDTVGAEVTCTFTHERRPQIRISKYHDLNRDGMRDDGEPGVADWQVFLYIEDGNGGWQQIQTREVRTNSSGQANYTSLEPGKDHLVCEEARMGWLPTDPGANAVAHDGHVCQIVSGLVYGEVREVVFGNYEATLGCTVLDDFNRPDQSNLDGSWQGDLSGYFIENDQIVVRNGGAIFWDGSPSTFGADQSACVTLADNLNHQSGLALKVQQPNYTGPFLFVMYDADWEQIRVITNAAINWQYKTVATFAASLQAGDQLGARAMADGTVLIYVNGEIVGTVTPEDDGAEDLSFFVDKGGLIGLWNSDGSYMRLDDFGAATIE